MSYYIEYLDNYYSRQVILIPNPFLLHQKNRLTLHDALFNQTSECVAVMELDGRVLEVNRKFEELHGWKSEEIVGQIVPIVPKQDKESVLGLFGRVAKGYEISGVDMLLPRKDGSTFYGNVSLFPLRDEEGEVVACVGICRDISDNKKAEELLRKSEKLSVVGELAAGIAHEIRNPLTSLKGFLQLLKEQNTKYVDIMLSELERINKIVSEFMSLAKPQSIKFTKVDLGTILTEVVSFMQPQALLHKAEITLRLENHPDKLICEPNQFKQLLINIIKNAVEAMPKGGEVQICVRSEEDGTVRIEVIDQGEGIPEEDIARLGEPFYSLKESGTGLGLAVCYRIVEAHNGTLTFRSRLREGTTVEMVFPNTWE